MSKLNDVLKFEGFNLKGIAGKIKDNPLRLVYGAVNAASTKDWNKVLSQDDEALVDQWGGASSDTYRNAEAAGIDTEAGHGMHRVARTIAGAIVGNYGVSKLGIGTGSAGGSGGESSGQGSGVADMVGDIGLGGGGSQQRPVIQSEVKPVDSEVQLSDNDTLAQYNANQGRFNDGHRIAIQGDEALLYDGQGNLVGRAPNGPGLMTAIRSMQED